MNHLDGLQYTKLCSLDIYIQKWIVTGVMIETLNNSQKSIKGIKGS